jgi:hypothetical protein
MITPHLYQVNPWKGYVAGKLREGVKFLATRSEPFAMWVDSNDSLVLQPEDEIVARLSVAGFPVMIAAEETCWPDASRSDDYYAKTKGLVYMTGPRFINAGGFIGPIGDVMTAMNTALSCSTGEDDQRAWTTAYLAGLLPSVQIDHARRIFSCVGDGDSAVRSDSCVRHWNGRMGGRDKYWEDICATS